MIRGERVPKYTLRKLSVGLASVMIGSGILMNSPKVLAATTVQSSSQDKDNSKTSTQSGATQDENTDSNAAVQESNNSFAEPATTTNAEEKVVATNIRDTTQDKDKQPNANETTQNTTNVDKKDTEVTLTTPARPNTTAAPAARTAMKAAARPNTTAKFKVLAALPVRKAATAETPDPTAPDYSANTAVINDPDNLANDWMQLKQGKLKLYLTVRGLDNKIYVSSYADAQKKIKSMLISNRLDPNSLEVHVDFENTDVKKNIATLFGWDTSVMQVDTSRLGTDGIVAHGKSGKTYQIGLNHDGGNYDSYERMVKMGKDISKVGAFYMTDPIEANDTISTTIPVKYIGNTQQTTSIFLTSYFNGRNSYPGLELDFRELHPAQIETPAKPTTDKDTVTTGIYNNPQSTTSDWIKMTHGDAIGYYTAKGKDGKTYVTGYVAANGNSQSIFNVDQIDLNSLEYHLIYHNGDKEVGSGLWFSFADGKTIAIDTSRLGDDGPQLKSQQGWSYKWGIHTGSDGGTYYNSWAEYLKAHNNVGDQASEISMTGVAIKPDDTIEFNIPVKYTGQLSARTPSLTFSPHINDYGNGFTQNWADLYFTTVKKDLSEVKEIDLLPTEFMGGKPGESDWKLVKEISKDMPNGWDAFKISNFPTYKGSFNMDSLPKGDKPSVVYGSAQYFIDLSKIQEIFANHGYTVKYANNNGKAQEMPFYAYSTIPLAKRVDDDRPVSDDPSIWVIHVQAVPAIILNKDQHYVADPNAKPWDTTSMIDAIYRADDPGQRQTRDQLEKLPKTDVDISYEYQAPGAATAAAVDKVDLTKAGVYTVTYSHTYADGRVVKDSRKVYVDGVKPENKKITRTIIVHTPNGSDQKVIQTATLTREVILDATTGEIKSVGEWSTAKWEKYSAPEFKGYTPDKAQIDETTVNEDTQDTTVEISYTANETPEQPDHSVDDVKQETKDITRTIIVHTPNGTDQKVIQKATLTREVILDAATGEIKSAGKWSTAKWETYLAPEFKGYTPDKAQIDETTVNENTQDTTVEISYTANETPKQPDHGKDKDQGQNPQTPDSNENGKHHLSTGENTESSGSTTKTKVLATANKVTKNLPQTGEKENQLGLLGIVLASLGVFGLGWKKREHE
ncbi:YSIRK-type signal peptide-containing protein [Lactobacillus crispatus]|uniref:mucin-binding protein n=1 Tax=Lactobacillus crispatus TaxID=47770 RepID=UPI0015EB726D|nr:YSIRK-type signal peptide-containing protein [Lactobacillus crispatus]MBA2916905.1 YSIRK-type signal peptide-containing protein [Lactobacillus crispatus]